MPSELAIASAAEQSIIAICENSISLRRSSASASTPLPSANSTSGAIGKYQIMPTNWRAWSLKYLGNANAAPTPANQETVAKAAVARSRFAANTANAFEAFASRRQQIPTEAPVPDAGLQEQHRFVMKVAHDLTKA